MNILLIIPLIPLVCFLFAKPRLATWLLIFLCVFDLGFASRWLGAPAMLKRIPLLVTLVLFVRIFFDYLLFQNLKLAQLSLLRNVGYFIFGFFCLFFASNIYNGESLVLGLYNLRFHIVFFTLVYSIYLYIPRTRSLRSFIVPVVIIGLIQLPFTIMQNAAVNYFGVHLSHSALDMVSGTFIGYQPLVFCQCFAVGCLLAYQLREQKNIFRFNNYFIMLLLLIPLLLSYSRTSVAFMLITVFTTYVLEAYEKRSFITFLKTLFLMLVTPTIIGVLFYYFFWQQNDFLNQLNVQYVYDYYFREADATALHPVMGRGAAVIESIKLISQDVVTFCIGLGSGAVSSADFLGARGSYYQDYGVYAGIGRTQFAKNICEFGVSGIFLWVFFFFTLVKSAKKKNRSDVSLHQYAIVLIFISVFVPLFFYATITTFKVVLLLLAFLLVDIQKNVTVVENGK